MPYPERAKSTDAIPKLIRLDSVCLKEKTKITAAQERHCGIFLAIPNNPEVQQGVIFQKSPDPAPWFFQNQNDPHGAKLIPLSYWDEKSESHLISPSYYFELLPRKESERIAQLMEIRSVTPQKSSELIKAKLKLDCEKFKEKALSVFLPKGEEAQILGDLYGAVTGIQSYILEASKYNQFDPLKEAPNSNELFKLCGKPLRVATTAALLNALNSNEALDLDLIIQTGESYFRLLWEFGDYLQKFHPIKKNHLWQDLLSHRATSWIEEEETQELPKGDQYLMALTLAFRTKEITEKLIENNRANLDNNNHETLKILLNQFFSNKIDIEKATITLNELNASEKKNTSRWAYTLPSIEIKRGRVLKINLKNLENAPIRILLNILSQNTTSYGAKPLHIASSS